MLSITQISAPGDIAAVRDLVREFTDWAFARTRRRFRADLRKPGDRTRVASGVYGPPAGCFLLARDGNEPFATGSPPTGAATLQARRPRLTAPQGG